jgi:hypothetical protein
MSLPESITIAATLSDDERESIVNAICNQIKQLALEAGSEYMQLLRPMTPAEAAAWLGIGKSTLSMLTNNDDDPLPAVYPLSDNSPRYRVKDLTEWLEARTERRFERRVA